MLDIGGKHNLIGDINSIVIAFLRPPGMKAQQKPFTMIINQEIIFILQ